MSSDLDVSLEDLEILMADCGRDHDELKAHELEFMMELDSVRRKIRSVRNEMEYLEMLRDEKSGKVVDLVVDQPLRKNHRDRNHLADFDVKNIQGTLTMRHTNLLLKRLKTAGISKLGE